MSVENRMRIQNAVMVLIIVASGKMVYNYLLPNYLVGLFTGVFVTLVFFHNYGILKKYKDNERSPE